MANALLKEPLYPLSSICLALYQEQWEGEHVKAARAKYAAVPQDWLDEVVRSYRLSHAASLDMRSHDGSEWPNHPVYSARGGYGMAHAFLWSKHEAKIRQFLGAKRPDLYEETKDDPAQRSNAAKIVDQLEAADKAVWKDIKGIRMTERPWGAYVTTIEDVRPHGENLSIVTVDGNEVVANRKEDGSFRWAAGEVCVYVPEGAIIPDDVLEARGYWDADKQKGLLEGKKGNRVKMRRFAGHESRGLLFKVEEDDGVLFIERDEFGWVDPNGPSRMQVHLDDDVTGFFDIEQHVAQ